VPLSRLTKGTFTEPVSSLGTQFEHRSWLRPLQSCQLILARGWLCIHVAQEMWVAGKNDPVHDLIRMKRGVLILVSLLLVVCMAWAGWIYHKRTMVLPGPIISTRQDTYHPVQVPNDWRDYHETRLKILHDNPDMNAEYEAIRAETVAEQKKLEAAMIKADPKVGAILAKLASIRKRNALAAGVPPAPDSGVK